MDTPGTHACAGQHFTVEQWNQKGALIQKNYMVTILILFRKLQKELEIRSTVTYRRYKVTKTDQLVCI
jgi:hypothetical protein